MAKKALILKAAAKPKFAVRAYTRCQLSVAALGVPQVRCAGMHPRDGQGRAPGFQGLW